jgi:tRNA A-37 threonylcarbamoyl transferase component Bud32
MNEPILSLPGGGRLRCGATLRLLPGKRRSCVADLDGRPVFAKLYLDPRRGTIHLQRELAGVTALQRAGIPTAGVLWQGRSLEGIPLLVSELLPDGRSLGQVWAAAGCEPTDPVADGATGEVTGDRYTECRRLLREAVTLLARHHGAGLMQQDLHPGNLLFSGGHIYTLDGAGVRAFGGPLGRRASLENLALLLAQFAPLWEGLATELLGVYAAARGWSEAPATAAFLGRLEAARQRRWRAFRRKLFRDCTAFVRREEGGHLEVLVRDDDTPELRALLANPDASRPVAAADWLKDGRSSAVWRAQAGGRRLVVKRYNPKGLGHGLKQRLGRGRARRSWENAHRLRFLAIPTPRPVALVRQRLGPLRELSWFIAEEVAGREARDWFLDPRVPLTAKRAMAPRVVALLRTLRRANLGHGDLKASNLLLGPAGPCLTDLDALRQYPRWRMERVWAKDWRRFLENWQGSSELVQLFRDAADSDDGGPQAGPEVGQR